MNGLEFNLNSCLRNRVFYVMCLFPFFLILIVNLLPQLFDLIMVGVVAEEFDAAVSGVRRRRRRCVEELVVEGRWKDDEAR
ncbi:unnamed protein product [Linum trigynum]|uniref:Transmembrane protein n=1 Tax=Linum trigynum TaxID=586398 RepID=A0AAV2GWK3_9ROSI